MKAMRYGSLFAGVGGFDRGFDLAGMECAWQVEINDRRRAVLRYHYPHTEKFRDVREVGSDNLSGLGAVDLICGGFPCQDLSLAGRREGFSGERSSLWFEFHRILGEIKPEWVVIENVPGLLSGCGCVSCQAAQRIVRLHKYLRERAARHGETVVECPICVAARGMLKSHSGRNFAIVLSGLVELGFSVAYRILDAEYMGVPQRRRRVFIVGHRGDDWRVAQALFEPESGAGNTPPRSRTGPVVITGLGTGSGACSEACGEDGERVVARALARASVGSGYRLDLNGEDFIVTATLNSGGNNGGFRTEPAEHLVVAVEPCGAQGAAGGGPDDNSAQAGHILTVLGNSEGNEGTSQYLLGVRTLTPRECNRLQGFPDDWDRYGMVDGQAVEMSDSFRYNAMGDAVATVCSEWIGRRIMSVHREMHRSPDAREARGD